MAGEQAQAQEYQRLVLAYEEVGNQIQALIEKHGGRSEDIPTAEMGLYRQLAAQRDDLYNQIKEIEAGWLAED